MKKCAVYLILQKKCQDIGDELFRIQDTQMKYDRYGKYRNADLGAHTPSPVIDLLVGCLLYTSDMRIQRSYK